MPSMGSLKWGGGGEQGNWQEHLGFHMKEANTERKGYFLTQVLSTSTYTF